MCFGRKVPPPYEHYKSPEFGLDDILLPRLHSVSKTRDGDLSGHLLQLDGQFRIKLFHSAKHVEAEFYRLTTLLPNERVQERLKIAFGLPEDSYRTTSRLVINFMDQDPSVNAKAAYMVVLKSPYGHGISIEWIVPMKQVDELHDIIRMMVTSVKWHNRNEMYGNVSKKLLGTWVYTLALHPDDGKPGANTVSKKTYNFEGDERFSFTHVELHTPLATEGPENATSHDEESEVKGLQSGSFELFKAAGGKYTLLLIDDEKINVPPTIDAVTVTEKAFVKSGEEFVRSEE